LRRVTLLLAVDEHEDEHHGKRQRIALKGGRDRSQERVKPHLPSPAGRELVAAGVDLDAAMARWQQALAACGERTFCLASGPSLHGLSPRGGSILPAARPCQQNVSGPA
jgi:hypothetical protein